MDHHFAACAQDLQTLSDAQRSSDLDLDSPDRADDTFHAAGLSPPKRATSVDRYADLEDAEDGETAGHQLYMLGAAGMAP